MKFFSLKHIVGAVLFLSLPVLFAQSIAVGSGPVSALMHGEKLYVVNADSNTVSVIDTLTQKVSATIPVGLKPLSATISGKYLYIGNSEGSTITVIDTEKDLIDKTISIPRGLVHIVSEGSYLFALGNSHITVLDSNTHAIVRTTSNRGPVGTLFPTFFTTSNRIFIHYANDIFLTILWVSNGTMSSINIGHGHNSGAVIGKYLYTVNTYPSQLHIAEVSAPQKPLLKDGIPVVIPLGKDPVQAITLGSKIYVNNSGDNTVSIIDSIKNTVIKTLPVGTKPLYMYLSGRTLFVLNNQQNTISVIDTSTDTVVKTLTTGMSPSFAIADKGNLYILNTQSNSVNVFDIDVPTLTEINSDVPTNTYKEGDEIILTATFHKNIVTGSQMRVVLNNKAEILLDTVSGQKLSGKYIIKAKDSIAQLTVQNIISADIKNSSDIPGVSYSLPDKKNLGDLKKIAIQSGTQESTTPDLTCQKLVGLYRLCPLPKPVQNYTSYQANLLCEGIITDDQADKKRKSISRYEGIKIAVNMRRATLKSSSRYVGSFGDVSRNMYPVLQAAMDQGLIADGATLDPHKSLNRIEAYTLLMESVCLTPVPSTDQEWPALVHEAALAAGVTKLTWEQFRPQYRVTRKEVFLLASRLADWADTTGGCGAQVCAAEQ